MFKNGTWIKRFGGGGGVIFILTVGFIAPIIIHLFRPTEKQM